MVSPESTPIQLPLFALEKRCTRCSLLKPLEEFHCYAKGKSGRVAWCKACVRDYGRLYRDKNRESRKAKAKARRDAWTDEERAAQYAKIRAWYQAHRAYALEEKRIYHEINKERDNAYRRAWHHANKERAHAQNRAWHAAHPGYKDAYNKEYYQRTRPKRIAYRRAYYAANTPSCRASSKAWQVKNRERYSLGRRMRKHERRAREVEAEGSWTRSDVTVIYGAQHGRCAYCLVDLGGGYSVDHMTPISKGGANWPWNLCLACPACNLRKHTKSAGQFLAMLLKESPAVLPINPPLTKATAV